MIFDLMEKPKVNVVYNGVKLEILRRYIMKTGYFADNYENGKDFCWNGPYSQEQFSEFLNFLENSRYRDGIMNPVFMHLLEAWDCPEIIDDLISQVKSGFDHTIIHNGNQYRVNLKKFSSISQCFCSQIEASKDNMVSVCDEFSEEAFGIFLDCLHGIKSLPKDEK